MEGISYIEVNLIGIIICVIIFTNMKDRAFHGTLIDTSLFRVLLVLNAALLLTDICTIILNDASIESSYILNSIVSSIYYILQPAFSMLWLFYCHYKLFGDRDMLRRRLVPFMLPFFINVVAVLMSTSTHTIFYIDSSGVYHRGPFFFLSYIVPFLYYVLVWVIILIKLRGAHDSSDTKHARYLAVFPLPALISAIIQGLFYGVSLLWICSALLLLIIFINIQNNQISTDPLTGLYNRRYFDRCLREVTKEVDSRDHIFVTMIDIDNFKTINDVCGHQTGDRALICSADLLRRSCGHGDIIARYGGDEFVILGRRRDDKMIAKTISLIRDALTQFNEEEHEAFSLSFSIGTAVYGEGGADSAELLIGVADAKMYVEKQGKSHATATAKAKAASAVPPIV